MPFLASWGATGLLIEWEDTFPYHGRFAVVRGRDAYTEAQVMQILSAARRAGLEVIPLVQTFGHLEFVLKHGRFAR